MKKILKNVLMFILGFCFYVGIEICFRDRSYFLMGLLGGIIFCIGGALNDKFSWKIDLLLQCGIISFMITVMEAIIGNIDYYFLHMDMWNYSNRYMSFFNNKICLLFSIIWFFMGFAIVFAHDAITYYWLHEGDRPEYWMLGKRIWQMPKRECDCDCKGEKE